MLCVIKPPVSGSIAFVQNNKVFPTKMADYKVQFVVFSVVITFLIIILIVSAPNIVLPILSCYFQSIIFIITNYFHR